MPWSDTTVHGHTCHLYEPAEPSPHGYVIIYLHGVHLGKLSDHSIFAQEFDRYGLRVICPVTEKSWWTNKICQEFDPTISAEAYVVKQVVPHIAERWGSKPPQLALLGTSMGGQGALRLAYRYPNVFPTVVALAPAIDFQWCMEHSRRSDPIYHTLHEMYEDPEQGRQDSATLHIHPLNWPRNQFFCCDPTDRWFDSVDKLRMKLYSLGVPYECDLETRAGGHGFEYYSHMAPRAIGFIAQRLEQERKRVV